MATSEAKRLATERREMDSYYPLFQFNVLKRHTVQEKNYLIGSGWLKREGGLQLVGATGIGKSVFNMQLAACLATGTPFMGIPVPRPLRVVIEQAENDADTLKRDLLAIQKFLDLDPKLLQQNLFIRRAVGLTNGDFADLIRHDAKRFGADVIFVDPYQSYVSGDINKAETFRNWVHPLEMLMTEYKFGLPISVHMGKPRKDMDDWDTRAMAYAGAGTSAMANWARSSCELFTCKADIRRFRLHFSKGAEYTCLAKEGTDYAIRDLYIEHSESAKEPYWRPCQDQSGDIVRVNYAAEVQRVAHENPKWSMRKIADQLHCSVGQVSKHYPEELRKKTTKKGAKR
jgi:RecA-family ATPase